VTNQSITRLTGYTPVVMSLVALAVVWAGLAEIGFDPARYPKDEGSPAHIWQLLMVLQLPIILLFIIANWRSFKRALPLLTLQLTLLVANFATVYFFKL
jgi:hypothetical protein